MPDRTVSEEPIRVLGAEITREREAGCTERKEHQEIGLEGFGCLGMRRKKWR